MKRKVAISMDSSVLNEIDRMAGSSGRKRSNVIEGIIKKSINIKKLDTAVLLAGGKGSRLRPITYEIPKPLVPIRGKPVIQWQVDMLRKAGIERIIISLGESSRKIEESIKGDDITFVCEKEPLGTGGALNLVKNVVGENFLVMNSDTLFMPSPNIAGMFEFHKKNKNTATLLVLMKDDVSDYGQIKVTEDSRVVSFMEKPGKPMTGLISAGMYIFSRDIFGSIKPKCSIENDVFPQLVSDGMLHSYFFDGRTFDIGTMERYEKAIKEWKPAQ